MTSQHATRSPRIDRALLAAFRADGVEPRKQGAAALALRYATLIEEAEEASTRLDELGSPDQDLSDQIESLRSKFEAQRVISDLGPKLLAALASIGLAEMKTKGDKASGGPGGVLDELRQRRRAASAG